MADETARVALARRQLEVDPPENGGIDPELANALVLAIVEYPSFATACASCGVTARAVRSMLQRGIQVGAPSSLADFTLAFARADAHNARAHWHAYGQLLAAGRATSAALMLRTLQTRWPMDKDNDIMAMLSGGRRADNLRARLEKPSSLLLALLRPLLVAPNETWTALLRSCGWARALPREGSQGPGEASELEDAQEDESEDERELDPEPEGDE